MTKQQSNLQQLEKQLEQAKTEFPIDTLFISQLTAKILKIKTDMKSSHAISLFNIHTKREFQTYLAKNLRVIFSSTDDRLHGDGTFIVTDKVHELDLDHNTITYEDDTFTSVKVGFYDFLTMDSDDVIEFTRTQAIVKLWSTLRL